MSSASSDSSSDSSDDETSNEQTRSYSFFDLKVSSSASSKVTCCAFDASGNRVLAGTADGALRTYDFGSGASLREPKPLALLSGPSHQKTFQEESSLKAVRSTMSLTQQDPVPVDADFNAPGRLCVVARLDPQVLVYDRNAGLGGASTSPVHTTTRGDPYIHDTSKTKGHTASVTLARWSRHRESWFLTTSMDGSFRTWDVEKGPKALMGTELGCLHAYRLSTEKPGVRLAILAADLSRGEESLACLTSEGTLQIWPSQRGDFGTTSRPAHVLSFSSSEVTSGSVAYSEDGRYLAAASRSAMKVWDARMMRAGGFGYTARSGEVFAVDSLTDLAPKALTWCEASTLMIGCARGLVSTSVRRKGRLTEVLRVDAGCASGLKLHPDSRQLAFGGGDGVLRIRCDDDRTRVGAYLALQARRRREYMKQEGFAEDDEDEEEARRPKRAKLAPSEEAGYVNVDPEEARRGEAAARRAANQVVMTGEEFNAMQQARARARRAG